MFIAPQSKPWQPNHNKWLSKRVISEYITRMYCARSGTSRPNIFSMAKQ